MATGATNSRNTVNAAVQAAQPVLRSGEHLASTPAALKNPNSKTYRHLVPGAKFTMPDGLELQFLGGFFVTDDLQIQAELDRVANKTTSMIYTDTTVGDRIKDLQNGEAKSAADTAGKDSQ